jgi:hypothetical protein
MRKAAFLISIGIILSGCAAQDEESSTVSRDLKSSEQSSEENGQADKADADEGFSARQVINQVDWLAQVGSTEPFIEESEPAGLREDGSGAFRTHCIESHIAEDDPLVFPGEPGQSHLHVFFGNPAVDAFTTIDSLQETEQTTCDGVSVNKSGYWVPALINAEGERIRYIDPLFYYKTGYHVPAEEITPMPQGLRIIAGNMMSDRAQDVQVAKFRCESWEAPEPQFSAGDPLDHIPQIPDCEQNDIVEMRLVFPQCWDGENLSSDNYQDHMAYPIAAQAPNVGTGYCPDTHPVAIPEISYNFGVRVTEETGPSTDWRFVTDPAESEGGGYSFHGDWMNGWDEEVMETIVSNCLNDARECMTGLLGDGTELQPVPLD